MSRINLIRKEITEDTMETFNFGVVGFEFLVKNFSNYDIFIAFNEEENSDNMIKIPANCSQICVITKETSNVNYGSTKVYALCEDGDAEVEVQLIL